MASSGHTKLCAGSVIFGFGDEINSIGTGKGQASKYRWLHTGTGTTKTKTNAKPSEFDLWALRYRLYHINRHVKQEV
jgi:hypothetical protein